MSLAKEPIAAVFAQRIPGQFEADASLVCWMKALALQGVKAEGRRANSVVMGGDVRLKVAAVEREVDDGNGSRKVVR